MWLLSIQYALLFLRRRLEDRLFIIPIAFDFSDGIETSLMAGLPPGLDASFDVEEDDLDNDYDFAEEYPADEDPADTQVLSETGAQEPPERTVRAYLVKYTAYRTFVCDFRNLRCSLIEG